MDSRELHVDLSIEDIQRIEEYTGQKLIDENGKPILLEKSDKDPTREEDESI